MEEMVEEYHIKKMGAGLGKTDFWTWCGHRPQKLTSAVITCTKPARCSPSHHITAGGGHYRGITIPAPLRSSWELMVVGAGREGGKSPFFSGVAAGKLLIL